MVFSGTSENMANIIEDEMGSQAILECGGLAPLLV
jgi:hypothetical protein